jgi:hypothetical protein
MQYTNRTGTIWVRNYDEGIVKKLGGTLSVTGEIPNTYYVPFGGQACISPNTSFNVPVIFGNPEPVFANKVYPAYNVKRDDFQPNLARWHSVGSIQENWGVTGTEEIVNGVSGFSSVETSPQAWPYDFTYTVTLYARYEYEAQTLLRNMMRRFPPISQVIVKDSLDDYRSYACLNNNPIQDLSEIVDISERLKSYSISVLVQGELDLVDPIITESVQSVVMSANKQ